MDMRAIDPANVFTDRTLAPFTPKKGRTYDEVVKRMKAGAKEELEKISTVSITEWGPKTLSSNIKNIGNCTFPYPGDNPWFPDWKDLKPTGPMILDWRPSVISNLGDNMAKEREKLAQIKGLIEGATLSVSTNKIDALLDKILEVIEE